MSAVVEVLVVDDDPADALLVAELLRDVTDVLHRVTHVPSLDALARVVAAGVDADVLLLDLTLPGTSGTEAVERAAALVGDLPIVVHSGHEERAIAADAVHAGAEAHLVKGAGNGADIARVLANARERHRSRRALSEALAEAGRANDELRRMQQAQDEFVAIASHELRTPVTVASGFVRLLAEHRHRLSEDQRADLLMRATAAMDRLQALTDDLLAVSRAGHGRVDARTAAVELRDTVVEAVATSEAAADDVDVLVPPGLAVVADRVQLTRVVRNLVDNGTVHGRPPVHLHADADGDRVRLHVSDHGDGVPPSFVPEMFDRFTQADRSTVRTADGTGLGLAIVRGLVEAVGGTVGYERVSHGGSRFTVELARASVPVGSADGIGGVPGAADPGAPREAVDAGCEG